MILTLPIATRERLMLRLQEAEHAAGKRPTRIVLNPVDHGKLKVEMRKYGFYESKYLPKPLHVLNVPVVKAETEAPEARTVRFEWSE